MQATSRGDGTIDRSENQHTPDEPHRSFVVTDFSVREIPGALVTYGLVSAVCIVFGLAVESLTSFWQGFVLRIAFAMAAVAGLSLLPKRKAQ
jgi:hypothetical protein